jgi:hypothetical protein
MLDTMRHAGQHSSHSTPALVSALNYLRILATTARPPTKQFEKQRADKHLEANIGLL